MEHNKKVEKECDEFDGLKKEIIYRARRNIESAA